MEPPAEFQRVGDFLADGMVVNAEVGLRPRHHELADIVRIGFSTLTLGPLCEGLLLDRRPAPAPLDYQVGAGLSGPHGPLGRYRLRRLRPDQIRGRVMGYPPTLQRWFRLGRTDPSRLGERDLHFRFQVDVGRL